MAKEPVVRLEFMTGEVIFDLMLSALAVEYARQHGYMRPHADFRLFLDEEEISTSFPHANSSPFLDDKGVPPPLSLPHEEIDSRLDAVGLRVLGDQPGIGFTEWRRWKERMSLEGADLPGVYLLAHFQTAPGGPADPKEKQIAYIGETHDRTLARRWRDFERVIAAKAENHSGGMMYRQLFGHRVEDLFVAAMGAELKGQFSRWFIKYVEAKLLWEFVWQWGSPPMCNQG